MRKVALSLGVLLATVACAGSAQAQSQPAKAPPATMAWADGSSENAPAATGPRLARHSIWLNPGFYSVHFDTHQGLRNENWGLGVEVQLNQDWSATAGRFINSDNAYSNYVGAYYQPFTIAYGKWGAVMGVFNGYPKAFDGGWFPAVLPVATWESRWLGLSMVLVPPLKDRLYGAFSFMVKVRVLD